MSLLEIRPASTEAGTIQRPLGTSQLRTSATRHTNKPSPTFSKRQSPTRGAHQAHGLVFILILALRSAFASRDPSFERSVFSICSQLSTRDRERRPPDASTAKQCSHHGMHHTAILRSELPTHADRLIISMARERVARYSRYHYPRDIIMDVLLGRAVLNTGYTRPLLSTAPLFHRTLIVTHISSRASTIPHRRFVHDTSTVCL